MTSVDRELLSVYAEKITRVEAWPASEDRSATLARLNALHGDLLDQVVLSDPIVPDVLTKLDAEPAACPASARARDATTDALKALTSASTAARR